MRWMLGEWIVTCLTCQVWAQMPPGSISVGSGSNPFLPMRPNAPNAQHHVGIAYNLLKGNPDGEHWSTGGKDLGVSMTRRIFSISPGDNPPEAIMEHHDGCQYSHGFSLFYNTKSYQDKLYINVQTSGAADADLKPYGFTLSSAYQAVAQNRSRQHDVFQDTTTYCKMGHVRYSLSLASTSPYPIDSEFAMDICNLPKSYNATAYMKFLEDWGTVIVETLLQFSRTFTRHNLSADSKYEFSIHIDDDSLICVRIQSCHTTPKHVVTEVTIGKLTTKRYLGHIKDLFRHVFANASDEIKNGGPLYGYPDSYVIDLDSFKYRKEYKYIVGAFDDMLTVGDMYYNDVIGKTLQTIDMALDSKYWHSMNDYVAHNICAAGSNAHLSTWQANIILALKAYPNYKMAVVPAVQPLAMPAMWPYGNYSLLKPSSGCPRGFVEGNVTIPQPSHTGGAPTGLNLDGQLTSSQYELHFCTNDSPAPTDFDVYWPTGDYCIMMHNYYCPRGFWEGYDILYPPSPINSSGVVPQFRVYDKIYYRQIAVYFCCRIEGTHTKKIYLPTSQPFYMYRYEHGCQAVSGMTVQDQALPFYFHVFPQYSGAAVPYLETKVYDPTHNNEQHDVHLCYYTPLT